MKNRKTNGRLTENDANLATNDNEENRNFGLFMGWRGDAVVMIASGSELQNKTSKSNNGDRTREKKEQRTATNTANAFCCYCRFCDLCVCEWVLFVPYLWLSIKWMASCVCVCFAKFKRAFTQKAAAVKTKGAPFKSLWSTFENAKTTNLLRPGGGGREEGCVWEREREAERGETVNRSRKANAQRCPNTSAKYKRICNNKITAIATTTWSTNLSLKMWNQSRIKKNIEWKRKKLRVWGGGERQREGERERESQQKTALWVRFLNLKRETSLFCSILLPLPLFRWDGYHTSVCVQCMYVCVCVRVRCFQREMIYQ